MAGCIWTIGHSTRSWEEFVALLDHHAVQQVADVRSFPTSRRFPHFDRDHMQAELPNYRWFRDLGGRRRADPNSTRNAGWRVAGFRAYADHTQTPAFQAALADLERWAAQSPTVFLCAEALWLRCHRQILADALVARGWEVHHITSKTAPSPHRLTDFAQLGAPGEVTYPAKPQLPFPE